MSVGRLRLLTEVWKEAFSMPVFVSLENRYILDNIGKIPSPLYVSSLSENLNCID